jgi:hypothetical protein
MPSRKPWTPAENAAVVTLYFDMLDCATCGEHYNKAALIRYSQTGTGNPLGASGIPSALADRSRGSIEAKLMNCTAAHADLINEHPTYGAYDETMDCHGYRALANYQRTLKDAMADELLRRFELGFGEDLQADYASCKSCGQSYRHNNLSFHDAGYCSPDCRKASAA